MFFSLMTVLSELFRTSDSSLFRRKGVYSVHKSPGRIGVSNDDHPFTVAATVEASNTAKYLLNEFFYGSEVLFMQRDSSQGMVGGRSPTGPYMDRSILLVACPPNIETTDPTVPVMSYDLPQETRREFLSAELTALQKSHQLAYQKPAAMKAISAENCLSVLSGDLRTSRTVRLPHLQVGIVDIQAINERTKQKPTKGLQDEEKILSDQVFMTRALTAINRSLSHRLPGRDKEYSLHIRTARPYGYAIVFNDIDVAKVTDKDSLENVLSVMEAHHASFSLVARALERSEKMQETISLSADPTHMSPQGMIAQPSYRRITHFNEDNKLEMIISPEFFSHAGVFEASGVTLHRTEKAPLRYPAEDVRAFQEKISEAITATFV